MKVAVIGAGASGSMAALTAAQEGSEVLLFDRNDRIGRKLYATGNGRCNLSNRRQNPGCYYSSASPQRVWRILNLFSAEQIMQFFEDRGILLHDRAGYVYPRTDQASTVAEFFERELRRAGVQLHLGVAVTDVSQNADGTFRIQRADGHRYAADRVILSCGGLAGPRFGCSGDGYRFSSKLGHTVLKPLPALTSLRVQERCIRRAAGVRCSARVRLLVEGKRQRCEEGELQITKQGLSGIVIFQVSRIASAALMQKKRVSVTVDFLPELRGREAKWDAEKNRRLEGPRDMTAADWMLGLANRGVIDMLLDSHGIASEKKVTRFRDAQLMSLMDELRAFHLHITGTGGFDSAQTTAGGVPLEELTDEMESVLVPGLYMTGEMTDADGLCGGYNLTWAFSTGRTAGKAAGRRH